ncbi:MAG: translation initiation factor IF-3 [Candidatus Levybacteria bacterium RBG_16_35_11]|nr:MAG: translation initiation factor IF-3 [Candidatus Levybacteria bacterium RBG_16_35_11]
MQRKFYRVNERIFAPSLRVLDAEGKQIGVIKREEALVRARELELDLVEIAPKAVPPVAKIVDFKKFLYQEEKKRREEKKKARVSETKEVRLGPFMDDHDLQTMVKRAREFLESGNKVRLVVRFAGRQITHPEFGEQVLGKAIDSVWDVSKIEREKHFEGRQLIVILSPERKKHEKEENKEISS